MATAVALARHLIHAVAMVQSGKRQLMKANVCTVQILANNPILVEHHKTLQMSAWQAGGRNIVQGCTLAVVDVAGFKIRNHVGDVQTLVPPILVPQRRIR